MRFMLCKLHCPSFICFCKSSPHICNPGPLKLENAPPTVVSVSDESSDQLPAEVRNGSCDENPKQSQIDGGTSLKSSLKKKEEVSQGVEEAQIKKKKKKKKNKKVQWMDFSGKELVEIREFESCEADELDLRSDRSNQCVIL